MRPSEGRPILHAMNNKNYPEGKREFEIAARFRNTKETTDGIRWANDEIAKGKQATATAQKAQQEQQKKDAEFARLLSDGNQAASMPSNTSQPSRNCKLR